MLPLFLQSFAADLQSTLTKSVHYLHYILMHLWGGKKKDVNKKGRLHNE